MIILERFSEKPGEGILGEFLLPNGVRYWSMEQNWAENAKGISCVPEGRYTLYGVMSPKYGRRAHLYAPDLHVWLRQEDVPSRFANEGKGRSHVMIHPANIASELRGCIALGMGKGKLFDSKSRRTVQAVLSSRTAVDGFQDFFFAHNPKGFSMLEIRRRQT